MSASGGKADVKDTLIQADAPECPLFPKAVVPNAVSDGPRLNVCFSQKRTFNYVELSKFDRPLTAKSGLSLLVLDRRC